MWLFTISTPPNQGGPTQSDEALPYMSGVTHQEPKRLWFHYTLSDLISYPIYYNKPERSWNISPVHRPQVGQWHIPNSSLTFSVVHWNKGNNRKAHFSCESDTNQRQRGIHRILRLLEKGSLEVTCNTFLSHIRWSPEQWDRQEQTQVSWFPTLCSFYFPDCREIIWVVQGCTNTTAMCRAFAPSPPPTN